MRKKIIVFAGFILMTVGFSMLWCSCQSNFGLNSIDANLKRITGIKTSSADSNWHYFDFEDIYNQDDTIFVVFDSLAIEVKTNYHQLTRAFIREILMMENIESQNFEKVTDIIITSNKNYNAKYPSGSSLKELISVRRSHNVNDIMTVDNMIEESSHYDRWWYFPPLLYTFNTPPETEEVHDITIKYITEKRQMAIATVKNVMILK